MTSPEITDAMVEAAEAVFYKTQGDMRAALSAATAERERAEQAASNVTSETFRYYLAEAKNGLCRIPRRVGDDMWFSYMRIVAAREAAEAKAARLKEALREAASIISDLFASVRMGDPSRTFDYEWERRGLSWLAAQWARDPGTLINMWTADKVRSHHAALAQSAPVKAGG